MDKRSPGDIVGIEVKAAATVRSSDFKGLRRLAQAAGKTFRSGIVLYDGEHVLSFGNGLYAAPVSALWASWPEPAMSGPAVLPGTHDGFCLRHGHLDLGGGEDLGGH